MKKVLIFMLSLLVMTSCYTTWTTVGNYEQLEKQGLKSYKYDQKKQLYLFNVLPLGHSHAKTPNEPCEVISKFKLIDFVIPTVTCGILGSRTVIVNALQGASDYALEEPVATVKEQKKVEKTVVKPKKDTTVDEEADSAPAIETKPTSAPVVAKPEVKVGDRVVYKLRGQWWYYATVKTVSAERVTIELQNGVVVEKTPNDVMKVEYLN
ncbi:MAG: hypothetical protein MJ197_07920 [Bacteroidales bacterium]|nr:hypothetical protein [Bacteroidales bacterium]